MLDRKDLKVLIQENIQDLAILWIKIQKSPNDSWDKELMTIHNLQEKIMSFKKMLDGLDK